ncbi:thiamine phosphate synthase [Sulfurimonas sp. SAG-AH-194-C21]|nr:thiamine phosphate synthase [Sulfurimonas sp. SAG-AH-194-C21]
MKSYLITTRPSFIQLKKHRPAFALYRDKETTEYSFHAQNFVQMCKNIPNLKAFLHQDYKLADTLNASGVHLTSLQFDEIRKAKDLGLEVIISCHTKEEVKKAEELGADYVTYSPIFDTPNKGAPKGIKDLKELVGSTSLQVFALGGIITEKHVQEVEKSGAFGFASIRYFR